MDYYFQIVIVSLAFMIIAIAYDRQTKRIKAAEAKHEILRNAYEQHRLDAKKAIHALNKAVTGLNDNFNRVQKELGIRVASAKIMQRELTRLKQHANTR